MALAVGYLMRGWAFTGLCHLCDGRGDSAGAPVVVTADKLMADGLDYRLIGVSKCRLVANYVLEQGGQMWWKVRNPGIFRALLLLALIVTVSPSCERERKAEKPDRERPPQPKLQKMLPH